MTMIKVGSVEDAMLLFLLSLHRRQASKGGVAELVLFRRGVDLQNLLCPPNCLHGKYEDPLLVANCQCLRYAIWAAAQRKWIQLPLQGQ